MYKNLTGVDRYDVSTNTWDKVSGTIQRDLKDGPQGAEKECFRGGSAYGKIFIAGGEEGE